MFWFSIRNDFSAVKKGKFMRKSNLSTLLPSFAKNIMWKYQFIVIIFWRVKASKVSIFHNVFGHVCFDHMHSVLKSTYRKSRSNSFFVAFRHLKDLSPREWRSLVCCMWLAGAWDGSDCIGTNNGSYNVGTQNQLIVI